MIHNDNVSSYSKLQKANTNTRTHKEEMKDHEKLTVSSYDPQNISMNRTDMLLSITYAKEASYAS